MSTTPERYAASTLTELCVVSPNNFDQQTITLDGHGNAHFGGQGADADVNINTANNITVHEVNAAKNLVKHRNKAGEVTGVFNSETGDYYITGKVYAGMKPEELEKMFSSN